VGWLQHWENKQPFELSIGKEGAALSNKIKIPFLRRAAAPLVWVSIPFTKVVAALSEKIEIPYSREAAALLDKIAIPLYKRGSHSLI
jgi:hypothetical protein